MDKRSDAIETVVDVFNEAMVIQELYLKKSKFKELSMSETHVLDAVDKVEFPSMTNVEKETFEKTKEFVEGFETAMEDDFNTADGIIHFLTRNSRIIINLTVWDSLSISN